MYEIRKDTMLLGLDYGEKVIGLATYRVDNDPFPTPYGRIIHPNNEQILLKNIKQIVETEFVDLIILGVPYFVDGKTTKMGEKILDFGQKLGVFCRIPVEFQDETLSTKEAKSRMNQDPSHNFRIDLKKIDALCATIILEDFIFQWRLSASNREKK